MSKAGILFAASILFASIDVTVSFSFTFCNYLDVLKCITKLGSITFENVFHGDNLDQACSIWSEYNTCMQPLLADCSGDDTFQKSYEPLFLTIDYVCNSHYDEFKKYSNCFATNSVSPASTKCFLDAITRYTDNDPLDGICRYYEDFNRCSTGYAACCGYEAAKLMNDFNDIIFAGVRNLMSCSDNIVTFVQVCNGGSKMEMESTLLMLVLAVFTIHRTIFYS